MKKIILASKSPRRRELMSLITEDFVCEVSDVDESAVPQMSPFDLPVYLAKMKAMDIAKKNKDAIVIGGDTVVILDNTVLTKPKDEKDAFEILSKLSNKTHTVVTGCCIVENENYSAFSVSTQVEFYDLSEREITEYINSGEGKDKAGSYGIQGKGALFVKKIDGDYFNVVGLPVARLKRELDKFISKDK
ncbi:MAG: septum formation inhibitor Maf [Oscillospiraceae bacterium]|nr:septum formation inhibitor Maf [Candidatus Ruminococcus equi]